MQDLSEYGVENASSLEKLIKFGNERRTVAATGANQASSRSHAILVFNVVTPNDKHPELPPYSAKLQIVDLAGSERFLLGGFQFSNFCLYPDRVLSVPPLTQCVVPLPHPARDRAK